MDILLTNDDGYDSPGLHAMAAALDGMASVTIVAPKEDHSAMGRVTSTEVTVDERGDGFAVGGTPVDCIIVGLEALDLDPDIVISGCNEGANLGAHALGRSGTVSAAVEATFFGIPAIATSLYVPLGEWPIDATATHFDEAIRATTYLLERVMTTDTFSEAGYLNVNAPLPTSGTGRMRLTQPTEQYRLTAEWDGDSIALLDPSWEEMESGDISEPLSTDRGAVFNGDVSVTPLAAPHRLVVTDTLEDIVGSYGTHSATTSHRHTE